MLTPVDVAAAFQDDEKVYLAITPGFDSKGAKAKWRGVPAIVSADTTVVSVDQTSPAPDGSAQAQSIDAVSAWLVAGGPGTTDVSASLEVDSAPGADQQVNIHCAVAGGDSTGAGVVLADAVKQ